MHRKIANKIDIEHLQNNLDILRNWVVVNGMKTNPVKCKALGFTRIQVQNPLGFTLVTKNFGKRTEIILGISLTKRIKLCWPSKLHNAKSLESIFFLIRVLKKGNRNTKLLSYKSLVIPIPEYRAVCWNTCRGGRINTLHRAQTIFAPFTHHRKDYDWDGLNL